MVARRILSRDVTCYLCGAVTGRLVRLADAPPDADPKLILSPNLPNGPRYVGGRMVCAFCGGSLFLDAADERLVESQREYPRERRGRPPGSGKNPASGAGA